MKPWPKWFVFVALQFAVYPASAYIVDHSPPVNRGVPAAPRALVEATEVPGAEENHWGVPSRQIALPGKLHAQLLRVVYAGKPRRAKAGATPATRGMAAPASSSARSPAGAVSARTHEPVLTVSSAGPGQAGYVHYFVIRKPDASLETQIGIELPDQRIAWSFPELGVVVSPFIESGSLPVSGKRYQIEHLYGIRPFPDDASMRMLQLEIVSRVAPWVDDETQHCDLKSPARQLCVSCLGFVMRILFPGRTPAYPAVPGDFKRAGSDAYYTTEDLLLYLAGLHGYSTPEARRKRIDELTIPLSLREELLRLVDTPDASDNVGSTKAGTPQNASGRNQPGARTYSRTGQKRPRPIKTL